MSTFSMQNSIKVFSLTIIFAILLSSVALLNGFPLVFSDSGTYLNYSIKGGVPIDRPVFYSWIIAIFNLNTKLPLFSVIASQALITSVVMLITFHCLQRTKPRSALILAIFLTIATSLPWFVGWIMPDFFLGIGLLSAYVLICHYYSLNDSKRIFLLAIFVSTNLVHYSNTPVLVSTILLFLVFNLIYRTNNKSIIIRSAILIFISLAALTANYLYTKSYSLKSPTAHFLVNRLVDDGIIQKLLNEHCINNNYILCPYKDNVKPSYLWSDKTSPFRLIGGFKSSTEESWKMILDSLKYYPLDHFSSSTRITIKQLFSFNTGDGLKAYDKKRGIYKVIKQSYNAEFIDFTTSRQLQGELKKTLSFTTPIHNVVVGVSFLTLIFSLFYRKDYTNGTFVLTIFILSALVSNAAICGIFSGAYDRYQSRIIWLVPFVAAIIILRLNNQQGSISEK